MMEISLDSDCRSGALEGVFHRRHSRVCVFSIVFVEVVQASHLVRVS